MADTNSMRLASSLFSLPAASPSFQNHTVDASNEGVAWVCQSRDANAITHLGFRYGARTGTPPTFIIGLESPSLTTGLPDGTYLGGGTPASGTFTPPADTTWNGLWQWVALDNAYTPTRGQRLCVTIRYSSGTIDGSNYSTFTTHETGTLGAAVAALPYALRNLGGTWIQNNNFPLFGLRTASTRYGNIMQSVYSTRSASTVGHRRAFEFVIPTSVCSTFTVRGLRFSGSTAALPSGKTPVFGLWSASGVIQNWTVDVDAVQSAATTLGLNEFLFDESSLTALDAGTTYYIGLEVADASNGGVQLSGFGVGDANDLLAHPGGTAWRLASFDGSSWTSDTVTRPFCELILDDMTGGSGGGGIMIPGGFTGGMQRT